MSYLLTWDRCDRAASAALARAFILSLVVHLLLFGFIEAGYRTSLWGFSPFALLSRWMKPALQSTPPKPVQAPAPARQTPREVREIPVVFVDVDPSQATDEPPVETPNYAVVTTRAGNPDTRRDTGQAKIDGRQDLVPKTVDTERAKPAVPLQPAPVVAQPVEPGEEVKPERPRDVARIGPTPAEEPRPATETRPETRPGDLAMAKPGPEQRAAAEPAAPNMPESVSTNTRPRPRTVAAARALMQDRNPHSALAGEKMFQDGGVRRFSVQPSVETKGSPLGVYDARFIAAVQQCWWALLEEQRYSLDRLGKVVVEFQLTTEGRITDMRVVESDVGEIYTTLCQLAITKPSPYEKWPADVRRMVGQDAREIRFTFYY